MAESNDLSIERGRWHPRNSFQTTLDQILAGVDSADYFNQPGMQWLQDAFIAGEFSRHVDASEIMLPTDDWPDFKVKQSNGHVLRCEATEAMEDGRKRGAEYADWKRKGYPLRHTWQEELDTGKAITPRVLQSAITRKVKKGYSLGAAALVVYLNVSSSFRDDEVTAQFANLTKPAWGPFNSVWVLWGSKLYSCWPEPAATNALPLLR